MSDYKTLDELKTGDNVSLPNGRKGQFVTLNNGQKAVLSLDPSNLRFQVLSPDGSTVYHNYTSKESTDYIESTGMSTESALHLYSTGGSAAPPKATVQAPSLDASGPGRKQMSPAQQKKIEDDAIWAAMDHASGGTLEQAAQATGGTVAGSVLSGVAQSLVPVSGVKKVLGGQSVGAGDVGMDMLSVIPFAKGPSAIAAGVKGATAAVRAGEGASAAFDAGRAAYGATRAATAVASTAAATEAAAKVATEEAARIFPTLPTKLQGSVTTYNDTLGNLSKAQEKVVSLEKGHAAKEWGGDTVKEAPELIAARSELTAAQRAVEKAAQPLQAAGYSADASGVINLADTSGVFAKQDALAAKYQNAAEHYQTAKSGGNSALTAELKDDLAVAKKALTGAGGTVAKDGSVQFGARSIATPSVELAASESELSGLQKLYASLTSSDRLGDRGQAIKSRIDGLAARVKSLGGRGGAVDADATAAGSAFTTETGALSADAFPKSMNTKVTNYNNKVDALNAAKRNLEEAHQKLLAEGGYGNEALLKDAQLAVTKAQSSLNTAAKPFAEAGYKVDVAGAIDFADMSGVVAKQDELAGAFTSARAQLDRYKSTGGSNPKVVGMMEHNVAEARSVVEKAGGVIAEDGSASFGGRLAASPSTAAASVAAEEVGAASTLERLTAAFSSLSPSEKAGAAGAAIKNQVAGLVNKFPSIGETGAGKKAVIAFGVAGAAGLAAVAVTSGGNGGSSGGSGASAATPPVKPLTKPDTQTDPTKPKVAGLTPAQTLPNSMTVDQLKGWGWTQKHDVSIKGDGVVWTKNGNTLYIAKDGTATYTNYANPGQVIKENVKVVDPQNAGIVVAQPVANMPGAVGAAAGWFTGGSTPPPVTPTHPYTIKSTVEHNSGNILRTFTQDGVTYRVFTDGYVNAQKNGQIIPGSGTQLSQTQVDQVLNGGKVPTGFVSIAGGNNGSGSGVVTGTAGFGAGLGSGSTGVATRPNNANSTDAPSGFRPGTGATFGPSNIPVVKNASSSPVGPTASQINQAANEVAQTIKNQNRPTVPITGPVSPGGSSDFAHLPVPAYTPSGPAGGQFSASSINNYAQSQAPAVDTSWKVATGTKADGNSALTQYGSVISTKLSPDGKFLTAQMSNGTYQKIDAATGSYIGSNGFWGNANGTGIAGASSGLGAGAGGSASSTPFGSVASPVVSAPAASSPVASAAQPQNNNVVTPLGGVSAPAPVGPGSSPNQIAAAINTSFSTPQQQSYNGFTGNPGYNIGSSDSGTRDDSDLGNVVARTPAPATAPTVPAPAAAVPASSPVVTAAPSAPAPAAPAPSPASTPSPITPISSSNDDVAPHYSAPAAPAPKPAASKPVASVIGPSSAELNQAIKSTAAAPKPVATNAANAMTQSQQKTVAAALSGVTLPTPTKSTTPQVGINPWSANAKNNLH